VTHTVQVVRSVRSKHSVCCRMRKDAAEDSGHSDAVIQLCSGDAFSQLCVFCALGFRRLTGLQLNYASLNLILAFLVCGSGTRVVKMGPNRWWIVSSDPRAVHVVGECCRALLLVGAVLRLVQSHARRPRVDHSATALGPLRYISGITQWTTPIHNHKIIYTTPD